MEPKLQLALAVLAGAFVVAPLIVFFLAGGNAARMSRAFQALRAVPEEPLSTQPSAESMRLLTLLQREGRLVDFLLEDIQTYPDAQVGAAVRDIHRGCQKVIREYLILEPIIPHAEGDQVEVPRGFDPSAIRVVGNVTGAPPFRGVLRHHGWHVREIKLPEKGNHDKLILMPAEVELS